MFSLNHNAKVNIKKYLSKIRHCKKLLKQLFIKRETTVMHFYKKSHILNDVIFTINYIFLMQSISAINYILLTQSSTLCKNDVDFIKKFMKILKLFSQNLVHIYSLLLFSICFFRETMLSLEFILHTFFSLSYLF